MNASPRDDLNCEKMFKVATRMVKTNKDIIGQSIRDNSVLTLKDEDRK